MGFLQTPQPFLCNLLFVVIPEIRRYRRAELQRAAKSLERIHSVAYILRLFAIIASLEKQFPRTRDERLRCLFNAHRGVSRDLILGWRLCTKRDEEEAELAAYTPRWLELADAALSATEKAAKALELAREEQQHIRDDIRRRLQKYAKAGGSRVKKVWEAGI